MDQSHPMVRQSLEVLMQAGLSRTPHVTWCKAADLVKDVQELRWVGQGSQGVVYEGVWQGATVAVKWSIADELDTGAYELLFSRLLSHPNVVQTYDAKVAMLDNTIFKKAHTIGACAAAAMQSGTLEPDSIPERLPTADSLQRCASYQSDEGFGDPLGRPSAMGDVRDMLQIIGAKPGQHITQMIMEYCDQGSLLTAISRGIFLPSGRFGSKVALRALYRTSREIAQGMFHLHCANVIHGDLKPANVLLMNSRKDRRGFVAKVSDFGLAQYCPVAGHVTDGPWGTLVFMAPERFRLNLLTPASDVWSFGVMLWQMYTAKLPYEGTRQAQLMLGITTNTLALPWPETAPAALVQLAKQCMAYSPAARPTFDALMGKLAQLEAEVRMEGVRLSFSTDFAASSTPGTGSATPKVPTTPGMRSMDLPHAAAAALQAQQVLQGRPSAGLSRAGQENSTQGSSGSCATPCSVATPVAADGQHHNSYSRGPSNELSRLSSTRSSKHYCGGSCPRSPPIHGPYAAVQRHGSASALPSPSATAALTRAVVTAAAHQRQMQQGQAQGQGAASGGPQLQNSPSAAMSAAARAISARSSMVMQPGQRSPAPFEAACSAAAAAVALVGLGAAGTGQVGPHGTQLFYSTAQMQQARPAASTGQFARPVGLKVDTTSTSLEISPAAAAGVGAPALQPVVVGVGAGQVLRRSP